MSEKVDEPDTALLDRIADALVKQSIEEGRKFVAEQPFPLSLIEEVFEAAIKASDREAAIILFCLVDDIATQFFKTKLTGKVPNGVNEAFFSGTGILATANNKLTLLAGLKWIRAETFSKLNYMRRIRNEFAHHVSIRSFDDQPIRDFIDQIGDTDKRLLEAAKNNISGKNFPASADLNKRAKYLIRSFMAIYSFNVDLPVIQASFNTRSHPRDISGASYDQAPENIKVLLRKCTNYSLRVALLEESRLAAKA